MEQNPITSTHLGDSSLESVIFRHNNSNDRHLNYSADTIIGNGSFGVVYQAHSATGEILAIKKVFQDRRYKNRELSIMQKLKHPNVIKVHDAFYTTENKQDEVYLNIVMDYMPDTIYKICRQYRMQRVQMPLISVKLYAYQLLRGLAYVHYKGILHRDVKSQNLLVDVQKNELKICDFGSAKQYKEGEQNISYICSRYYRAPELIFGSTEYTSAIDMWSAGCNIAELLLLRPLFTGDNGVNLLLDMIKYLGTPTRQEISEMNPHYEQYKFPHVRSYPLFTKFDENVPQEAVDLISKLCVYSPSRRLSAKEALLHPFFDELKYQHLDLPQGQTHPPLFNWNKDELKYLDIKQITPPWMLLQEQP